MKKKLLVLIILIINIFACAQTASRKVNNFGGLLIAYKHAASAVSIQLVETNLEIKPLNDKIAILNKIKPGVYSLLVRDKTKRILIKDIQVSVDSISIVPLYFFFEETKDTLSWVEKTSKFTSKVKIYGTSLTANIKGRVFDSVTNRPIEEANVGIRNFDWWGSKTNAKGNYHINNVLPGFFTVVANYPGAHRGEVLHVRAGQDSSSIVNFSLQPLLIPEDPTPLIWEGTIQKNSCR